ncbi:MAG: hypothetical protein PHW76_05405 [Alphaproteobacteria bacterium]|nr:hypothetical protein [Alphaproteobacteria bacterium]
MALRASGVLGRFPPEAFLQKLQPAFVGQIPKLEKHKIASAVWGLAVHSVLNPLPGGVLDLANALIDEAKTRKLSPMQAHMVNHACKRLSLEKAADSQTVICNPTTSPVEKKFFKLLNDAGFENPEGLNVLPQTGTQTDYASWINRKRVLFELDGPSHFLRDSANNSLIYNGQTRLMSALICEEDPTAALVRINWGVAQQLLENKKLFLMFITALRYSRPGAFAIKVRENEVLMSPIPYAQSPLSRPTISARLKSAQLSPGS